MYVDKLLALAEKFEEEVERDPFSYDEDPYYEEDPSYYYEDSYIPEIHQDSHNYYLVVEQIDGKTGIHSGWKTQEAANKAKRQLINERNIKGTIKVVPAMKISYRPYRLNPESNDSWLYYKDYRYNLNEDEDWVDPQDEKMGKASSVIERKAQQNVQQNAWINWYNTAGAAEQQKFDSIVAKFIDPYDGGVDYRQIPDVRENDNYAMYNALINYNMSGGRNAMKAMKPRWSGINNINSIVILADKFLRLVKAKHGYDPSCQCPDCIEEELRIKSEIKKEKSGPKHSKPKHTKNE